jgi:subtilisin family serine protease
MHRVRCALLLVAAAALVMVPSAAGASNDPSFGTQWALARISAEPAWAQTTGAGVRIGIVDTGVDLNHEDLAGKVVAQASCVGSKGDPAKCQGSAQDDQGHGSHVSGIAAALTNNAKGIAGVAPDAQLVVAKVLNAMGSGSTEDVNAGIKWVVDNGARVVNLSLGDPATVVTSALGGGSSLDEGVQYAWTHGAIPVVAAGNSNLFGLGLEGGSYGQINAIIVGATTPDDKVANYSTPTGQAKWAVLAPGGAGSPGKKADDVYSTFWVKGKSNSYESLAGTSMAAPHVSGAVALLLAEGYTPVDAVQRLLNTADPKVQCGANSPTCHGRIDVAKAVAEHQPVPAGRTAPASPAPSPH